MNRIITCAAIAAFLPLAPTVATPNENKPTEAVAFDITDWLSCSKKPQLPWCK